MLFYLHEVVRFLENCQAPTLFNTLIHIYEYRSFNLKSAKQITIYGWVILKLDFKFNDVLILLFVKKLLTDCMKKCWKGEHKHFLKTISKMAAKLFYNINPWPPMPATVILSFGNIFLRSQNRLSLQVYLLWLSQAVRRREEIFE